MMYTDFREHHLVGVREPVGDEHRRRTEVGDLGAERGAAPPARLRPRLLMGFYESLEGEVCYYVSVVAEDGLVPG